MRALQRSAFLAQAALRRPTVCSNTVRYISTAERDAIRAKMQACDDTPVYLRGGVKDKILFNITVFLVMGGVLHTFKRVYDRA